MTNAVYEILVDSLEWDGPFPSLGSERAITNGLAQSLLDHLLKQPELKMNGVISADLEFVMKMLRRELGEAA